LRRTWRERRAILVEVVRGNKNCEREERREKRERLFEICSLT